MKDREHTELYRLDEPLVMPGAVKCRLELVGIGLVGRCPSLSLTFKRSDNDEPFLVACPLIDACPLIEALDASVAAMEKNMPGSFNEPGTAELMADFMKSYRALRAKQTPKTSLN